MRKLTVLLIALVLLPPSAVFAAASGMAVYQKACGFCHDSGVAGAPKLGDKVAWKERLGKGIEGLSESVLEGKGAMPPKGGNASLSEAEVRAAVEYMVEQSK
ncbi:cytochrome c5 [Geothermobacter ehrlichii]|uniref:Cytochrome c5 n=1 Tax=Geothermobacter ehrlichii TaxID=213224 RepID=A0A5D3WLN7_9BACT|nr:c-type cytochrome [Geothermobacter ehrlichii]TYO99351.1 cytochrome c5 [Geothermobacter ehrlichii]